MGTADVASSAPPQSAPARVLTLRHLVVYGIVLIQPIAPVGIFGIASKISEGHVATTILLAMAAMMLTAWSYGRMAARYPSAGSAYTYVGRSIGVYAGFVVGWAMFLDYLIIPVLNLLYAALTLNRLLPAVPYALWVGLLAIAITALNLRGVSSMARANNVLLAVMTVVIGVFVVASVRYLSGAGALWSIQPFYDPQTFHFRSIMTATSLAALTYIGFDGVTTLAEETRDPRRTVPLATVLTCLLTGVFSVIEIYLAQRVWPDYRIFPSADTAFLDVTRRVGGEPLFQAMGMILIVACFGTALAGQAGAARLLYAMGRENVLPRRIFGRVNANVCIIGVLGCAGALLATYEMTAELLNFGAFLAFIGVNLAAIREFVFLRPAENAARRAIDLLAPAAGAVFCLAIWWSLPLPARLAGATWLAIGIVQIAVQTRGFRKHPMVLRDPY